MFTTVASSRIPMSPQVLSLRVLPEARRLSVIMRNGDITMIPLDEDDHPVQVLCVIVVVYALTPASCIA